MRGPAFQPLDRQAARALVEPARHTRPTIVARWSSECPHRKKNLAIYARITKQDKRLRPVTIAAEPAWRGELPRTLLFDGRGSRQAASGAIDEATLRHKLGL